MNKKILRKITMLMTMAGLIGINSTMLKAITNQEIIDNSNKVQKELFDKYFNSDLKSKNNSEAMRNLQTDILIRLVDKNNNMSEVELQKLKGKKQTDFRKLYFNYKEYFTAQTGFAREILTNFAGEKSDIGHYMYTNSYNLLEGFDLNMNTIFEGEKDSKTINQNVNTVLNYYYYSGDKISKEEYLKMSNEELRKIVQGEFAELNKEIDAVGMKTDLKKGYKNVKSKLAKLEKIYNAYDSSFEVYVNYFNFSNEDKENIKKLIKIENIANLRFFRQAMQVSEEKEE